MIRISGACCVARPIGAGNVHCVFCINRLSAIPVPFRVRCVRGSMLPVQNCIWFGFWFVFTGSVWICVSKGSPLSHCLCLICDAVCNWGWMLVFAGLCPAIFSKHGCWICLIGVVFVQGCRAETLGVAAIVQASSGRIWVGWLQFVPRLQCRHKMGTNWASLISPRTCHNNTFVTSTAITRRRSARS